MAKLHEEVIVLKVSQHLKDAQPESQLLGPNNYPRDRSSDFPEVVTSHPQTANLKRAA